jgi:hypothetical protein
VDVRYPDALNQTISSLMDMSADEFTHQYGEQQVPQPSHPGNWAPDGQLRTVVEVAGYRLEFDALAYQSATEDIATVRAAYASGGQAGGGAWQLAPENQATTFAGLETAAPAVLDGAGHWMYFHDGVGSELLSFTQSNSRDNAAEFASTQVRDSFDEATTVVVTSTGKIIVARMNSIVGG